MFLPIILFAFGLILLIKGGDWFVDGATKIAHRIKIPEIIVGATIVSIGTTLPEVMVSATSAVTGHGEIAYGNAIGSIICNTALVSAITIAVMPNKVNRKTFMIPVIFFFIAAALYTVIAYATGRFDRWVGIVLLVIFVIYMFLTIYNGRRNPDSVEPDEEEEDVNDNPKWVLWSEIGILALGTALALLLPDTLKIISTIVMIAALVLVIILSKVLSKKENNEVTQENAKKNFTETIWFELILLIIGAALIAFGADLLVDNGTLIATALGVPESVIALTFVALGTSLPELVTAITSLVKGHGSLSLGNVIGANLFNLVLVSGMSITLSPFTIPMSKAYEVFGHTINGSLLIDIPLMLFVMLFMTVPALITGKLKRFQGIILLVVYLAFCVLQFVI